MANGNEAAFQPYATGALGRRQRYLQRLVLLRNERESWVTAWRELSDYIQPSRSRFLATEVNKGTKKFSHIINGTPTYAADVLAAGMMAGITSPARTWFRLSVEDPDQVEDEATASAGKEWCAAVEEIARRTLLKSNVYDSLHSVYTDIGTFGVTALHVDEDDKTDVRTYVFPVGQYFLASNDRNEIDTCFREFSMTVSQLVKKFGKDNCSAMVQRLFASGQLDAWILVVMVVEPNDEHTPGAIGPKGKKFRSVWFESGGLNAAGQTAMTAVSGGDVATGFLREGGYDEFPVLTPRWDATGEDVYGTSPGSKAIGDSKALQQLEKRKLQVVDKIVNPPMVGPTSLQNGNASLGPGDMTYVDTMSGGQSYAPVFQINPQALTAIREEILQHSERIKRAYFADLWLMLSEADSTMTAREVAERHEEKMLQLGPVMERLQNELLRPLIERVIAILFRRGKLPKPPDALQGRELRIVFVSIMAQAQKLLGTTSIERLTAFAGNLAAGHPDVLDKLDFDQIIDEYADMLTVPPQLIRPDEEVAKLREQRQQAQQQAAAMQQVQGAADAAKTMSQADTGSDNALTKLLGNLGPPGGAAGIH